MIPQFPEFKNIELSDREEVRNITSTFAPYSDYNFTSLWAFDTDNSIRISQLNNNLVVHFSDYITRTPFLSFIGQEKVEETIDTLINYATKNNLPPELKLIPECVIKHLGKNSIYTVCEDEDNHDYILSVDKTIAMAGGKFEEKRNHVNRFNRKYGQITSLKYDINLSDTSIQKDISSLYELWVRQSPQPPEDIKSEGIALHRVLYNARQLKVRALCVFIEGKMQAFAINEIVHQGYSVIHFAKTNKDFSGIIPFLTQQNACFFSKCNVTYINYEQDLGIEKLKNEKKKYDPVHQLKKFIISKH